MEHIWIVGRLGGETSVLEEHAKEPTILINSSCLHSAALNSNQINVRNRPGVLQDKLVGSTSQCPDVGSGIPSPRGDSCHEGDC